MSALGGKADMANLWVHVLSRELQAHEEESESVVKDDISELTNQVLYVLSQVDHLIGSSKLGKLVLAGAIAGLATGGGLAAAAVFTLSIAVWDGPAAFKAAVEAYTKQKQS
jgi:hypothetical protein